ncbi:MAG: rhomboid family intramembrane serine protease [Thaumarchaeota archaeon 13_1_40CM_4_38_7]|nr:MAG: rhomboid family intramembrane serine protease [Thaumarchaeota archaeon 13_1_40CM_4_38_7]OLD30972.1 MAG: rhomboid family intramembrane serine protease [Thaumarchaeota archaeon 13_1_40CM_2_39_7]TLY09278.1 MAG: rhomboid family intramembrane serine protease [Nitrososphaerota archaeon]
MLPIKDENPKPPGYKPYVTYALILINVLIFFWEIAVTGQILEFTNKRAEEMLLQYGTVPSVITNGLVDHNYGVITSIFSSMFLHAGIIHIGGNMLFLWIFGDNIEYKFGRGKYLVLYLFWGLVAGFVHIMSDPSSQIPAIGASGAISGVLGAYLFLFPNAKVMGVLLIGFFMRIRISAKWYLLFWFLYQNVFPLLVNSHGSGVAFFAHIGGFLIGLLSGFIYKKTHGSEFAYGTRYGWKGYT